jgi:signal transduction histidine kinase/ligand-binding sensor domain-containing protein/DNA-binding response OmpR family regulator
LNKFYNILFLITLSSIFCIKITAQNQLHFKQLPQELGWSNYSIKDIIQDEKGFLWIASWHGLAKYDGYTIKKYFQSPKQKKGSSSNKIICLFKDSNNSIWVGTSYAGLYKYVPETDSFIQYANDATNSNSLSNNNVWSIAEDPNGHLWIGTQNGLNYFDPEKETFQQFYHQPDQAGSLSNNFIYSLAVTETGDLWVGTEIGLNRLVKNKEGLPKSFINYYFSKIDYLQHNFIYTITPCTVQPNVLWIGTSIGLKKVVYDEQDLKNISHKDYYASETLSDKNISHPIIKDLLQDGNKLWIATNKGLNLMDITSGTFEHFFYEKNNPSSLNNDVINSLHKDCFGILWVGADKGLNQVDLNANSFNNLKLTNQNNVDNSIITDIIATGQPNEIWVSSNGGGLNYISINNLSLAPRIQHYELETQQNSRHANFVSSMLIDKSGSIWASTHGAGLLNIIPPDPLLNTNKLKVQQQFTKENQSLKDDYLMALLESEEGDIWIGYWSDGLSRFDKKNNHFHHYQMTSNGEVDLSLFPNVELIETIENGKSYLWVGTRGNGLFKLFFDDKEQTLQLIESYQAGQNDEISSNFITSIYQENDEVLWIGTESGLNHLNIHSKELKVFLDEDGLNDMIIHGILEDEQGNIWTSTTNGLTSISKNHFEINNYNINDGLVDDYFYQCGLKTSNGQLIFGGVDGLTIFTPQIIYQDGIPPKVMISEFHLANKPVAIGRLPDGRTILEKSISETTALSLNYQDDVISFEFVGLQFDKPKKNEYAYQLEGFDADWIYKDAGHRIAHYTSLPYDEYVFKVKAANSDGVWSEPTTLQLTINPPWWHTTWAYGIYSLLFLGLLYGVKRITSMRAEYQHSLQLEKLERQQLEAINRTKLQFFTNISHELRTPLTLIISPLEQLLRAQKGDKKEQRIFNRMYHNATRLLTMISQLLDIRKSEAGLMKLKVAEGNIVKFINENLLAFKGLADQQEIALKLETKFENIPLWFDRDQLEKVFFNLLSNAIKFTPKGGEIKIAIEENKTTGNLQIFIQDNGSGIPEEHLGYIFDRFYQVDNAYGNQQMQGSGIGLALTKNIIDLHQGTISVTSQEMQGTTFTIQLPLGATHFKAEEKIANFKNSEHLDNYLQENISEDNILVKPLAVPKAISNKEKPMVLLVEDNVDIRAYLKENLQSHYQIKEAVNGVKGLSLALEELPDLVIADISMPEMDGIELCKQLKTNILTSHIPVILLTARTSLLFKLDGLETGADDYITKPFNMRLLLARVQNLIQSRQQLQLKFAKNFDLSPVGVVMNSLDETLLAQLKNILEEQLGNGEFSVEELAHKLHMSRMQLYRKTKSLTAKTPSEIIREFRLQRAGDLLKTKRYNIADVTYQVGYNDLKTFRRQFKKFYGVTPSEYV